MKHKNNYLIISIISALLLLGCGQQKLSQQEIENVKEEIKTLISEQSEAYETGNIEYFKNAVADEITAFRITKQAICTNLEEWTRSFQLDFQNMDSIPWSIKFGELRHLSIQVSETGDMATAIYEEPFEMIIEGESQLRLLRMATTWRNENGEWKIVQWLGAQPVE